MPDKTIQFDISPIENETSLKVEIYIDGVIYPMYTLPDTAFRLVVDGIVKQVQGQRHNDKGQLVTFDYPNGLDSVGVKYTSEVFVLKSKKS